MVVALAMRPVQTGWETSRQPATSRVSARAGEASAVTAPSASPGEEPASGAGSGLAPEPTTSQLLKAPGLLDPASIPQPVASTSRPDKSVRAAGEPAPPRTSRRHHAALEARSYLEEHSILPFVERVLRTLVQDRPENPWTAIQSMMPAGWVPPEPIKGKDVGALSEESVDEAPAKPRAPHLMPSVGTWSLRLPSAALRAAVAARWAEIQKEQEKAAASAKIEEEDEAREEVVMSMKVEGLSYDQLIADAELAKSFEQKLKEDIAAAAGVGVTAEMVSLTLTPGSVCIAAKIVLPAGRSADAASALQAITAKPSFAENVVLGVSSLPGIEKAVVGELQLGGFEVAVVPATPKRKVKIEAGAAFEEAEELPKKASPPRKEVRKGTAFVFKQNLSTYDEEEELDEEEQEAQATAVASSLRRVAREIFLQAAADGRLANALHDFTQKPTDSSSLRRLARELFLQASSDGRLASALQSLANENSDEGLRAKARDAFLAASADGRLAAALEAMFEEKDAQGDAPLSPSSEQAALAQARDILVKANDEGRLAEALDAVLKTAAPSGPSVRAQARDIVLGAVANGSLADVARNVLGEPLPSADAEEATTEVSLRVQARSIVLEAAGNGRLKDALGEIVLPKPEVEALRAEATEALLKAGNDGSLTPALQEAELEEEAPAKKSIRVQARETLFAACQDGRLEAALQEAKPMDQETDQAKQDRAEVRDVLLTAALDGRLKKALAEAKPTDSDTDEHDQQRSEDKDKELPPTESVASVRQQARERLLAASTDGRLVDALKAARLPEEGADEVEDLRLAARSAFVQAAADGTLLQALRSRPDSRPSSREAQQEQSSPVEKLVDVRVNARNILMQACEDGRLESALQAAHGPGADDVEELRLKARAALMKAGADGTLADLLGKPPSSEQSSEVNTQLSENELEVLRAQACTALIKAAADGSLAAIIGANTEMSAEAVEREKLREEAREAILSAFSDKRLQAALEGATADHLEAARVTAKEALERACQDGSLEKALAASAGVTSPKADLEEIERVREQVREAFVRAGADGTLEDVLRAADLQTSSSVDQEASTVAGRSTLPCLEEDSVLQDDSMLQEPKDKAMTPAVVPVTPWQPTMSVVTVLDFKFRNLSFDKLVSSTHICRGFMRQVQNAIGEKGSLHPDDVEVELMRGSVLVTASVPSATAEEAERFKALVDKDKKGLERHLTDSVMLCSDIKSVMTDLDLGAEVLSSSVRCKLVSYGGYSRDRDPRMATASTMAPGTDDMSLSRAGVTGQGWRTTADTWRSTMGPATAEGWRTVGQPGHDDSGIMWSPIRSAGDEEMEGAERPQATTLDAAFDAAAADAEAAEARAREQAEADARAKVLHDMAKEEELAAVQALQEAELAAAGQASLAQLRSSLTAAFAQIDADGDGTLDAQELTEAGADPDFLTQLDTNSDGVLSKDEFIDAQVSLAEKSGDLTGEDLLKKTLEMVAVILKRRQEAAAKAEQEAAAAQRAAEEAAAAAAAAAKAALEAKVRAEIEARARADAEAKAKREAEAKAKADAEAKAKADAEAKAKLEAEAGAAAAAKALAEAEAKAAAKTKLVEEARSAEAHIEGDVEAIKDRKLVASGMLQDCVPRLMLDESVQSSPMESHEGSVAATQRTATKSEANLEETKQEEEVRGKALSAILSASAAGQLAERTEQVAVVRFSFEHLDYDKVSEDAQVLKGVSDQVRDAVCLRLSVPEPNVDVVLSKGSVKVACSIRPFLDGDSYELTSLQGKLQGNAADFLETVARFVKNVPGIEKAATQASDDFGLGGKLDVSVEERPLPLTPVAKPAPTQAARMPVSPDDAPEVAGSLFSNVVVPKLVLGAYAGSGCGTSPLVSVVSRIQSKRESAAPAPEPVAEDASVASDDQTKATKIEALRAETFQALSAACEDGRLLEALQATKPSETSAPPEASAALATEAKEKVPEVPLQYISQASSEMPTVRGSEAGWELAAMQVTQVVEEGVTRSMVPPVVPKVPLGYLDGSSQVSSSMPTATRGNEEVWGVAETEVLNVFGEGVDRLEEEKAAEEARRVAVEAAIKQAEEAAEAARAKEAADAAEAARLAAVRAEEEAKAAEAAEAARRAAAAAEAAAEQQRLVELAAKGEASLAQLRSALEAAFAQIDVDGNGELDANEFRDAGFNADLLAKLDANSDGILSRSEFIDAQVNAAANSDDKSGEALLQETLAVIAVIMQRRSEAAARAEEEAAAARLAAEKAAAKAAQEAAEAAEQQRLAEEVRNKEEVAVVRFSFEKLDYDKVRDNEVLSAAIETQVRDAVVVSLHVPSDYVDVVLSSGSVAVTCSIRPLAGNPVAGLTDNLSANPATFLQNIADFVKGIKGIGAAATDDTGDLGLSQKLEIGVEAKDEVQLKAMMQRVAELKVRHEKAAAAQKAAEEEIRNAELVAQGKASLAKLRSALEAAFAQIDIDGDGTLDAKELAKAGFDRELLRKLDKNCDGELSRGEFVEAQVQMAESSGDPAGEAILKETMVLVSAVLQLRREAAVKAQQAAAERQRLAEEEAKKLAEEKAAKEAQKAKAKLAVEVAARTFTEKAAGVAISRASEEKDSSARTFESTGSSGPGASTVVKVATALAAVAAPDFLDIEAKSSMILHSPTGSSAADYSATDLVNGAIEKVDRAGAGSDVLSLAMSQEASEATAVAEGLHLVRGVVSTATARADSKSVAISEAQAYTEDKERKAVAQELVRPMLEGLVEESASEANFTAISSETAGAQEVMAKAAHEKALEEKQAAEEAMRAAELAAAGKASIIQLRNALEAAFAQIDKDGNKSLDANELKIAGFNQALLAKLDTDADGFLSQEEFVEAQVSRVETDGADQVLQETLAGVKEVLRRRHEAAVQAENQAKAAKLAAEEEAARQEAERKAAAREREAKVKEELRLQQEAAHAKALQEKQAAEEAMRAAELAAAGKASILQLRNALEAAFAEIDLDGNKSLDAKELKDAGFSQALLAKLDTDADGRLSQEEFIEAQVTRVEADGADQVLQETLAGVKEVLRRRHEAAVQAEKEANAAKLEAERQAQAAEIEALVPAEALLRPRQDTDPSLICDKSAASSVCEEDSSIKVVQEALAQVKLIEPQQASHAGTVQRDSEEDSNVKAVQEILSQVKLIGPAQSSHAGTVLRESEVGSDGVAALAQEDSKRDAEDLCRPLFHKAVNAPSASVAAFSATSDAEQSELGRLVFDKAMAAPSNSVATFSAITESESATAAPGVKAPLPESSAGNAGTIVADTMSVNEVEAQAANLLFPKLQPPESVASQLTGTAIEETDAAAKAKADADAEAAEKAKADAEAAEKAKADAEAAALARAEEEATAAAAEAAAPLVATVERNVCQDARSESTGGTVLEEAEDRKQSKDIKEVAKPMVAALEQAVFQDAQEAVEGSLVEEATEVPDRAGSKEAKKAVQPMAENLQKDVLESAVQLAARERAATLESVIDDEASESNNLLRPIADFKKAPSVVTSCFTVQESEAAAFMQQRAEEEAAAAG
eukprot:TRINITY_DN4920_c0_g1_i17.p1 TRINITY_DN4920_c0_g1~~TRINITY_DN4920_c0_g1_i17.p1  ORF type:complete len:3669 (-),score=1130.18 TRINITY_DN4920_c0_g1_i17:436-11016(-)